MELNYIHLSSVTLEGQYCYSRHKPDYIHTHTEIIFVYKIKRLCTDHLSLREWLRQCLATSPWLRYRTAYEHQAGLNLGDLPVSFLLNAVIKFVCHPAHRIMCFKMISLEF